jgi:DNA-directed RNA polymerase subunit RPC12/RpoP
MLKSSKETKGKWHNVNKVGFVNSYICDWCGFNFDVLVSEKKKRQVSDQIKCKHCGNFIKTWS